MGKLNGQRYHFLYRTTNLINKKYYYGVHSTYNLEDGYLGSGKRLKRAIKKYGKENFKIEFLEFFQTREEVLLREKEIVNEQLINDPLCMNLQIGGNGGLVYKDGKSINGFCNKETAIKGRLATNKIINERLKNDTEFQKFHRKRLSEGILKSNNLKRKNGEKINGHKQSDDSKRKIGLANSTKQKGENNSQFGTYWINKENKSIKIKKEDLEKYTSLGWKRGRLKNSGFKK